MAENKEKIESISFDSVDVGDNSDAPNLDSKKNIFDDFETDASLQADLQKLKQEKAKDIYFYIQIFTRVLQVFFFIGFFVGIIGYLYVYIQDNDKIKTESYLDPICNFIAGDVKLPETSCSSISYLDSYYEEKFADEKQRQAKEIVKVLPQVYESENFLQSKEVKFLLDRTQNKLKVLEVLSKFDSLKNEFLGVDRKKIICEDFDINGDTKVMTAKCTAYMEGVSKVVGFQAEKNLKVTGSSISLANSFLNYIQKKGHLFGFSIVERQKIFTLEEADVDQGYTNQTSFTITLKIN